MVETRYKNRNWRIETNSDGRISHNDVRLAVLMDIRAELQQINRIIGCRNFMMIPGQLEVIARNTARRRKVATTKKKR